MTNEQMIDLITKSRAGKSRSHRDGTCGYMGSLCYQCGKAEAEIMWEWAEDKPAPVAGEDISDYWRRIGGKFYDAWYSTAARKFQQASINRNS